MSAGEREERQLPSRTIAEAIRSQIESGELPPGAQLPSERDLASAYGTARNTAREAVRLLADAGLVITDQGKGSFVRPQTSLIRLGNDRYSPRHRDTGLSPFLLECAKQGKTGRFEVLSIDRVQPPSEVAERLGVSGKTKSVLRRENVFYADDDPVERVTTYIPWTIAKGTGLLQDEVPHQFGIHGILEDQGHVMTRLREEVSTRMPRPEETRLLRLRPGVPVLDVWHTSLDQDGQPYELTRFVMRGDMTGLLYDVPVEYGDPLRAAPHRAAGADLGIGVLVDQAGRPRLLTGRGHLGPAGPGRGGAVRHRARAAGSDPALRAAVGAYRGGGVVRQRGAVPAVRGGRADRGLVHGRDHQRDHAAVDRGAGAGRAAPEEP